MLSLEKQNQLREEYRQINVGWEPATETYAQLVRQFITPETKLLDLGCGRGGLIEQLAETHGRGILEQTIGLDPDWASLVEHRLGLDATVGFSHQLPFADNSFDLIFCSWLLEHLELPAQDFQELSRVLRPGGRFIFITPNKRHPISWLNRIIGRFSSVQDWLVERLYGRVAADTFPTWYRANSHTQLAQIAPSTLTVEKLEFVPDPTYLAFNRPMFRLMCWFETVLPEQYRLHMVGVMRQAGGK